MIANLITLGGELELILLIKPEQPDCSYLISPIC